jgi:hypothetical protein
MPQGRHTGESRNDLSQQLWTLGDQLWAKKGRPRNIAARSCKAGDQLVGDRIGHGYRDNGDCVGRLLGGARRCRTKRDNDIGFAPNQFSSQKTVAAFGRLDAAFNNAGVQSPAVETADAAHNLS